MELLKVLIADGAEEFRAALEDTLQGRYQVRSCGDGLQTLQNLRAFCPDLLVLDLMLPGMDGISLLQSAASMGIRPKVLALTRFVSDYVLEAVNRLGVSYVMSKPCDIEATAARIGDILTAPARTEMTEPEPRTAVTNLLLALNVPTKLHGYGYLREAVLMMAQRPGLSITKELYPAVGDNFHASAIQVERGIRTAIESAWKFRDEKTWRMYFSTGQGITLSRPSNAVFISRLADALTFHYRAG